MASTTNISLRVGIIGISGYSGVELAKILSRHPHFVLALAGSDKWADKPVGARIPLDGPAAGVRVVSQHDALAGLPGLDLVFLCTPPEASIEIAPKALAAGVRVVDLSGGFRLPASDYPRWYGFTHGAPDLLEQAVYSMPEAFRVDDKLRSARLVSNPGCYPTASSLSVLPLLGAGLIERDGLFIDAKSGTTGAGRKATEELSFSEVDGDLRAYRVLKHQHTPEIERILALGGHPGIKVAFIPHLLPVRRGILATSYARLRAGVGEGDVQAALSAFAKERPFVHVVAPEEVTLHASAGTNRVVLGARVDLERGVVVSFASIDNLVKGAAGQAVQNANLVFGLPETAGLLDLAAHVP